MDAKRDTRDMGALFEEGSGRPRVAGGPAKRVSHEPGSTEEEARDVLREQFYEKRPKPIRKPRRRKPKPDHYDVICISLYKEDLAALDEKVAFLKAQGHRKMSRSALIRFALDHVDLDALPRSY